MSYGFLMLKPKAPIATPDEIAEDRLVLQDPAAVRRGLDEIVPGIAWQWEETRWFGRVTHGADWYEFSVPAGPDHVWTIATSHGAFDRELVPLISAKLGLVAFDGQAMRLIGP